MRRILITGLGCMILTVWSGAAAAQEMTIERQVLGVGEYIAGSTVDVQVTFSYTGAGAVFALGLEEFIPEGWTFNSRISNSNNPAVTPDAGDDSPLTFAWLNIPSFPFTLTYRLNVPAGTTGKQELSGRAIYRTTGDEQQSPLVTTATYPLGETPEEKEDAMCGCAPMRGGPAGILGDVLLGIALCSGLTLSRRRLLAAVDDH